MRPVLVLLVVAAADELLRRAPETVDSKHGSERSAHFLQQQLYLLVFPPTVLTYLLTKTCWAMKLWRRLVEPLLLVF